ncbi:MAG: winged helix-turn-helix transcriptional regulator [Chloroflexi bacterium]|nr:winged helix-turn-helix transcriptional regulator [Chloroflexota bacterium]
MFEENDQSKSTRERVLQTLLVNKRCTINELAEAVDINPISVRHHINRLQAEGLVSSEEERHGVGRPRRVYFLTEEGVETFPSRYVRLPTMLLEQLKETMPPSMINQIFSEIAKELASDYTDDLEALSMEERLDLVKQMLNNEGFTVKWEKQGDHYQIHEVSCPYYYVGQTHPEVCSVDQTLISTVLSVPAEKIKCVLHGDARCTYIVPDMKTTEAQES